MVREKLATQVNAQILTEVRVLAQNEGQHLQVLLEEALADLLEKRKQGRPRTHVMGAYQSSHDRYNELYKQLAK